jgi:hypothetical protein
MNKKFVLKISLQTGLLFLAVLYGMIIMKYHFFPYSLLKDGYLLLKLNGYSEAPKEYSETDVETLISIKELQDIKKKRKELVRLLWGTPGLPQSLPSRIEKYISDSRYKDIAFLHHIDKLTIQMEYGLISIVYYFSPQKPNGNIILYHQGHRGDFYNSKEQIQMFIENGYAVMAFSMPLLGLNNQPFNYLIMAS